MFYGEELAEFLEITEADFAKSVSNKLEKEGWPGKYSDEIGVWAFRVALREQMIIPSEFAENRYSVSARRVLSRKGRKKVY